MNIGLITPASEASALGNSITARRWAGIFRTLGCDVLIQREWTGEECAVLVALHARRSHRSIIRFHQAHPERPLIVALTGTDLYLDLPAGVEAQESLAAATRVVVLQEAALEALNALVRAKTSVIYQSAEPPDEVQAPSLDFFEVCVLSHLRRVKDPLLPAAAARLLPHDSKIRVIHAGRALEPAYEEAARREQEKNPRYRWIGEQSHEEARQLLARSRLFVLSSLIEGGANAIAEAVSCSVPVLCSAIPGNIGMLGPDYPGFFPVQDSGGLAGLLRLAETDASFLSRLGNATDNLKSRFAPEREFAAWRELLQLLA